MKLLQWLLALSIPIFILSCVDTGGGTGGSSGSDGTGSGAILMQASADLDMNLGTTESITITIGSNDYNGDLTISIDRTTIDSAHTANDDITAAISDTELTISEGNSTDITLDIGVLGSAPSFDSTDNNGDGEITVTATLEGTGEEVDLSIPFQVNAVYESRLSVDNMGNHTWDQPTTDTIRDHGDDLIIRFINTDADDDHRIHGANAIQHQPPGQATAAATVEGQDGGSFEPTIDTDPTGMYYCHDHPGDDTVHTITFE